MARAFDLGNLQEQLVTVYQDRAQVRLGSFPLGTDTFDALIVDLDGTSTSSARQAAFFNNDDGAAQMFFARQLVPALRFLHPNGVIADANQSVLEVILDFLKA